MAALDRRRCGLLFFFSRTPVDQQFLDQMIQDYTKGLFRSFGFYQQKCIIERKCNQELHITSYVLRTPKLQPSKIDVLSTRTRQEKVLQEGLQQG